MKNLKLGEIRKGEWAGCAVAFGHFSTIHPGHIRYLKHAKQLGSRLIVALIGDSGSATFPFSQKDRAEALAHLGMVDGIVSLEGEELTEVIAYIRPAVLILGSEFKGKEGFENVVNAMSQVGGIIEYHAGDAHYATTALLDDSESDLKKSRKIEFVQACARIGATRENLVRMTESWEDTRLVVIGDTIVDQFAACEALGMSAEAPVVVVRELAKKNFVGGAAVVAAHIRQLGAKCDLVSVVGKDSNAMIVQDELHNLSIGNYLQADASRPTTFKKRYVVENQKLFRVSILEEHNIDEHVENAVIRVLRELAPKADGIVVSDFVYGMITPRILEEITSLATRYRFKLFGDVQCSSQMGSITRFTKYSLLCPNEREARLALEDKDSGLEQISQRLLQQSSAKGLIMKLASAGFVAYEREEDDTILSQAFPALSVNPVDVAGAGDSVLAIMATSIASGNRVMHSAAIACCMAAIAVEQMGNTPIDRARLQSYIEEVF